jgi:hypothetical protein
VLRRRRVTGGRSQIEQEGGKHTPPLLNWGHRRNSCSTVQGSVERAADKVQAINPEALFPKEPELMPSPGPPPASARCQNSLKLNSPAPRLRHVLGCKLHLDLVGGPNGCQHRIRMQTMTGTWQALFHVVRSPFAVTILFVAPCAAFFFCSLRRALWSDNAQFVIGVFSFQPADPSNCSFPSKSLTTSLPPSPPLSIVAKCSLVLVPRNILILYRHGLVLHLPVLPLHVYFPMVLDPFGLASCL